MTMQSSLVNGVPADLEGHSRPDMPSKSRARLMRATSDLQTRMLLANDATKLGWHWNERLVKARPHAE